MIRIAMTDRSLLIKLCPFTLSLSVICLQSAGSVGDAVVSDATVGDPVDDAVLGDVVDGYPAVVGAVMVDLIMADVGGHPIVCDVIGRSMVGGYGIGRSMVVDTGVGHPVVVGTRM